MDIGSRDFGRYEAAALVKSGAEHVIRSDDLCLRTDHGLALRPPVPRMARSTSACSIVRRGGLDSCLVIEDMVNARSRDAEPLRELGERDAVLFSGAAFSFADQSRLRRPLAEDYSHPWPDDDPRGGRFPELLTYAYRRNVWVT